VTRLQLNNFEGDAMALLTSHLLNGQDGTHADGVSVSLSRLVNEDDRQFVFSTTSDDGGRFSVEFEAEADAQYELVVNSGAYFDSYSRQRSECRVIADIVFRFITHDPNGQYHIPIIISSNSYSCWWSSLSD
jgi:5-hydroxyisourate hydrolase